MKRLIFLLTFVTLPAFAQVNMGGPDFDTDIAVSSNIGAFLVANKDSTAPTVLHDFSSRQYIAMRTDDLYRIYQVYTPSSTEKFVDLIKKSDRFIAVSLADYQTGFDSEAVHYSLVELYSIDVGYVIPMINARAGGTVRDIHRVITEVRAKFGAFKEPIIYAPASSPVW